MTPTSIARSSSQTFALPLLVPAAAIVGAIVANQLKQAGGTRFADLGAHQKN